MNAVAVIAVGCVAVLVFDSVGAAASRWVGFRYSRLAPGSYAVYTATSAVAAHAGPVWIGVVAGAIVAFVEATVGWAVSWWIGPGRPSGPGSLSRTRMIQVIALVTMIGAGFGLVGAAVAGVMP